MKETILVEGMTCKHCEKSVHDALTKVDGVEAVEIDLDTGKVDVNFDETVLTLDAIKETIDSQGYDVVG